MAPHPIDAAAGRPRSDPTGHPARQSAAPGHAMDALCDAIHKAGTPACVGVDPVLESLPASVVAGQPGPVAAIVEFTYSVLAGAAGAVPAVKFQAACFERYGHEGYAALEQAVDEARRLGLYVILDAKRGDIGTTSEHYAASVVRMGAQAITVNGYLGPSGVKPFVEAGLAVFVLVRTSNADSDLLQAARLADGRTVAQVMAEQVSHLGAGRVGTGGLSQVGAVVGATKSAEAQMLRAAMPDQMFLVPGYGAQGGTAADVKALVRPGAASMGAAGVIVNASRSVIYAGAAEPDWRVRMHDAALAFAKDVASILRS
ncbi:MAG: orotidine-5'-phosphate decarboxylase [Phycisphaerales bacterium]|nr:orotidine-5'-phosphate decarboxylase [Phycisphaerales bacterium]